MIGVYGGTFNPIHFGHLRTALEVKEALKLDEVRLLPSRQPPHRESPEVSAEQRLKMLQLAIEGESSFRIDTREIKREGPSYMVDTLLSIRKEMPDTPLCLILGIDAFQGLPAWHRWRELWDLAHLIVMQRPGYSPEVGEKLSSYLKERQVSDSSQLTQARAGFIFFQEVSQLDISASRIRKMIRQGKSPRYLLPDSVYRMIRQEGWYQLREIT